MRKVIAIACIVSIMALTGCAEVGIDQAYPVQMKEINQGGIDHVSDKDVCDALYPSTWGDQHFYNEAIKRHILKCKYPVKKEVKLFSPLH